MTIRILIVDDDQDLLDMLELSLQLRGLKVGVADCHDAALAEASRLTYDAVLLDVHLPEINGFTILKSLRSNGHDMPVVLHTAFDTDAVKRQAREARVDDMIFKPSPADIIEAKLRMVVAERAAIQLAV